MYEVEDEADDSWAAGERRLRIWGYLDKCATAVAAVAVGAFMWLKFSR